MPRRPRIYAPGLLYHVIARGNHKQRIFFDEQDYRTYLNRIVNTLEKYFFRLYAYILMPNHIHLLLEVLKTPLSKIMQIIQQRYTQYFNKKYKKVGHLFQGRYKAIICQEDAYLLELVLYIHVNSVRAGLVEDPIDYPWSSHKMYLDKNCENWLDRDAVLIQFSKQIKTAQRLYRDFVMAAISEKHRSDLYELHESQVLGDDNFIASLPLGNASENLNQPIHLAIETICKVVCQEMDISADSIAMNCSSHRLSLVKDFICLLAMENGHSLSCISDLLKRDITSVSHACSRLRERMHEKQTLVEIKEKIEKRMNFTSVPKSDTWSQKSA